MAAFWEPTQEQLKKIEEWASIGMTQEQIADNLGITQWTLSKKKKEFEQLAQTLKKGAFTGGTHVANALFVNATVNNNVTAQIFYLKVKMGWNDGSKLENNSNDSSKIDQSKERAIKRLKEKNNV